MVLVEIYISNLPNLPWSATLSVATLAKIAAFTYIPSWVHGMLASSGHEKHHEGERGGAFAAAL